MPSAGTTNLHRNSCHMKPSTLLLMPALLASGCAHHHSLNAPLDSLDPGRGYRFQSVAPHASSDDLLLMLAFSGGGTRAASLSYGVLEELARTPVGAAPAQHRLLNDVGMISSVSGGSFTAAYYGLYGDRIFRLRTAVSQEECPNRSAAAGPGALESNQAGFTSL